MTDHLYPSGIYGGDRNMFVFLVNDSVRIDDGTQDGLGRGFFVWNSEVRQKTFGFMAFLYRYVCGNHIVWGSQTLAKIRMIHLGDGMPARAAGKFKQVIDGYLNSSAARDQEAITLARKTPLAATVEAVTEKLTGARFKFGAREADEIVTKAQVDGGDPTNVWDLVNAATSLSQQKFKHADERNSFDLKASKLMEVVF